MKRSLRTSTALVTSLSLALQGLPAFAQEAAATICADGSQPPCPAGVAETPAPTPEAAPAPATEPAPATAPATEPAPAAEAPATTEPAPAAEAPAATEATPAPEPAPAAEAPATTEAAPAAEPAPTTETAPAAEAAPAPATEAAPATEPAPAAEAPQATEAAPATETAPATEPAPATATETAPATEPEPSTAPAPATGAAPASPDVTDIAKALAGQGAAAEAVPPLPGQPDAASGAAPVAAAAAAIAGAADGAATPAPAAAPAPAGSVAQVTEETVTDQTARSSSEDFANKVNQPAATAQPAAKAGTQPPAQLAPTVVEQKKGLSKDEKLLLLGVGALAVGAILSNNRRVEMNSGDRVVVSRDGQYDLIKDDDALLRQPGSRIRTETFDDGSTRTTVSRADGSKIVTIRDAEMRVLRRVHVAPNGRETLLIDDTVAYDPVDVSRLPRPRPLPAVTAADDEAALKRALDAQSDVGRRFSLAQVRGIAQVRALVPEIDLDAITFDSGSAAIRPDQAQALTGIGRLIQAYVRANPREVFLIEGHTDAVGGAAYNLALSDRRAESVALALTEYFAVPPENLVVQGYGEEFLKVPTQGDERLNRRAAIRRITGLLRQE
ncbi:MAG: OmpA family protein [Paracoccaceae bacterium]